MKLIYLGDVVGRAGRKSVIDQIPVLQKRFDPDFVILNGENAAHGFGITSKICKQFFDAGVSLITLGNPAWDQREIIPYISREERIIRPINYPNNIPGKGHRVLSDKQGRKILTLNAMGRLFMEPLNDPILPILEILKEYKLGENINAIVFAF